MTITKVVEIVPGGGVSVSVNMILRLPESTVRSCFIFTDASNPFNMFRLNTILQSWWKGKIRQLSSRRLVGESERVQTSGSI